MCDLVEAGYYIGIDVGSQSVRAGLVTLNGKVTKTQCLPIKTWNPFPDIYEQSSDDIWNACTRVVKELTKGLDKQLVRGIGFDATCSLVAVDEKLEPLSLSETGNSEQNVILWLDHRAVEEAKYIDNKEFQHVQCTGGKISPEMEPPKLLWLKKNLPGQWEKVKYFFELPDFLTWKATGSLTRSLCSLACKWMYVAWKDGFWQKIGLEDLVQEQHKKIGSIALAPGSPCQSGLLSEVAKKMNLRPGTAVATSIIDAYAGCLGALSCKAVGSIENTLALICGTSTCQILIHQEPITVPGIWGPYYSAMTPNMWCSEAGQSATGALLDHIINNHPATRELKKSAENDRHITDVLNTLLRDMSLRKGLPSVSYLTSDIHIWPDYHGNRSPLAEPNLKGMICGLTLSSDAESLAKYYLATIQSLAYSTKHIILCMKEHDHRIEKLVVCGGLAKNPLYVQMHADVTGLPVIVPLEAESVLLGAALLGATAAGDYHSVTEAMHAMSGQGKLVEPSVQDKRYHQQKYKAFHHLLLTQYEIRNIMEQSY